MSSGTMPPRHADYKVSLAVQQRCATNRAINTDQLTNQTNPDAPRPPCSGTFPIPGARCSRVQPHLLCSLLPCHCHGRRRRRHLGSAAVAAVGQAPGGGVPVGGRRRRRRVGGVGRVRGPCRGLLPGHDGDHGGVGGAHAAAPAVALRARPPEQRLRPCHRPNVAVDPGEPDQGGGLGAPEQHEGGLRLQPRVAAGHLPRHVARSHRHRRHRQEGDHLVPAVRAALRAGQPPAHRPLQPRRRHRVHEAGGPCGGRQRPVAHLVPGGHAVQRRQAAALQEGVRARRAADEAARGPDRRHRHAPGLEERQRAGAPGAAHRQGPAAHQDRRLGRRPDQRVRGHGALALRPQSPGLAEAARCSGGGGGQEERLIARSRFFLLS